MTLTAYKHQLISGEFFLLLLLICGCSEKNAVNTWTYSIEASGIANAEEQVYVIKDSSSYAALLMDGDPIEQQFRDSRHIVILKESDSNWRCDYTVIHSGLIDYLEWTYLADSVANTGRIDHVADQDLSYMELHYSEPPKVIKVWFDPQRENVIADLPNVPGLPIIVEKDLPNHSERWKLSSETFSPDSIIPKPQIANCFYLFPEVWLVHPTLGTPMVDNYSFRIHISAVDSDDFLHGAGIRVWRNDSLYTELELDDTSGIQLYLPPRGIFQIEAFAKGYLAKSCRMDFNSIPDSAWSGGFYSELDFTLFEEIPGFDDSLLDEPIGIAAFDDSLNNMLFDLKYTRERKRLIQESLTKALRDS